MVLSLALSLGIAFTTNFVVFEVLSILLGIVTSPSQILTPLTADLAKPERRASALSILLSGILLAILYARIISGVDRKSTRLNSSHSGEARMPSSA